MRIIFIILTALFPLFWVKPVFATDPPTQISPVNSSQVSSSKLEWQTPAYVLYSSNPYRVQVDDDSAFPSSTINKDYYTKNTYYSPILSEGKWYWRVKAKDSSGTWSDWSSVWSFTLQSTFSSLTPTPTPTSSPSPSSSAASSTSSSLFAISGVPSQINSDQPFNVSVNLSLPNNPNTVYYLAGAFKIVDGSRYFGLTKIDSSWTKYSSANFSNQYKITTDSSGVWSGNLEVKPDTSDSDYKGSGNYIFKIARYTQAGSQTWSNESSIKIVSVETSEQGNTSTETSSTSNLATSPSIPPAVKNKSIISTKPGSYDRLDDHTASVAAVTEFATTSAAPSVKSQKQGYLSWMGGLMIASGVGLLAFVYLRNRNFRETISNFFRKRD